MAAHKGETITAGELHAGHIGTLIRFREFDPGAEVATITTAELRQLSHDGTGTHVVFGLGAERETTLAHDQTLTLRSEEHTSELQSRRDLVCRLLLEKKK